MADIEYYILDLETNGTSSKNYWHEITQISIIRCADRVQLNRYIKPEHPERTNPQALEYTGRTMADLEKGDPKRVVVDFCNEFLKKDGKTPEDRCMVGHNIISFDKRFVHALWDDLGYVFPANLWMDTLPYVKDYAKRAGLDEKKFSLERAVEIVGATPRPGAHNAVIDTQNNYILWDKLKKHGV